MSRNYELYKKCSYISLNNITIYDFLRMLTKLNKLAAVVFVAANSSSEIRVTSTESGIVLSSVVTYYDQNLRVGWLHKYGKCTPDIQYI